MVVDTSALTAILLGEPEREAFEDLILGSPSVVTSAVVPVALALLLHERRPNHAPGLLDDVLQELRIVVRPFDAEQARHAREALDRFGPGRHPAGLTLGQCLVYGLAKTLEDELLFKGDAFAQTDLAPAWRPDPPV